MLIFLTGFIASTAHVVTGPDHLAAVTPLAIDSRKRSWMVGLGWGLGHTVGMLLIGLLFILFREFLPVEGISRHSETLIGLMLIAIGAYAIVRVYQQHSHGDRPHGHFHAEPFLYAHIHRHTHDHDAGHDHTHEGKRHVPALKNALAALLIGIIHGFAGFSHLFALLPSLALPSVASTIVYLVAFALGTVMTMVVFAFVLGAMASRAGATENRAWLRYFTLGGGLLAMAVGILWLIHPV